MCRPTGKKCMIHAKTQMTLILFILLFPSWVCKLILLHYISSYTVSSRLCSWSSMVLFIMDTLHNPLSSLVSSLLYAMLTIHNCSSLSSTQFSFKHKSPTKHTRTLTVDYQLHVYQLLLKLISGTWRGHVPRRKSRRDRGRLRHPQWLPLCSQLLQTDRLKTWMIPGSSIKVAKTQWSFNLIQSRLKPRNRCFYFINLTLQTATCIFNHNLLLNITNKWLEADNIFPVTSFCVEISQEQSSMQ